MKYTSIVLHLCAGFVGFSIGGPELLYPSAKITVRVMDESGEPVSDANVRVVFGQGGNAWVGEHVSKNVKGVSNTNGLFSASAKCDGHIGIGVNKDGYYESFVRQDYPGTYQNKSRWEPWNPTNMVVLKEIRNPSSMYAKRLRLTIPVVSESVGFDMQKGDWVIPYGKGTESDFIFFAELEKRNERDFDYVLNVSFPNEKDGIQSVENLIPCAGSRLRSGYNAPVDGYLPSWKQFRNRRPEAGEINNFDVNRKYYFRVRTKVDEHGNVISAHYGKIYGDFLTFTYYFNPTPNDRNLEFDPQKNLFKKLPPSEQVHEP